MKIIEIAGSTKKKRVVTPKYAKDTRVVIRESNGYFIGTITKLLVEDNEYTILLDRGDVVFIRFRSPRILGEAVARKTSQPIPSSNLHKWLIDGWEAEVTKEIPNKISNFVKPSTVGQNYQMVAYAILDMADVASRIPGLDIDTEANKLVTFLRNLKADPRNKVGWTASKSATAKLVKSLASSVHAFSRKYPGLVTTKHRRIYQTLVHPQIVADFITQLRAGAK